MTSCTHDFPCLSYIRTSSSQLLKNPPLLPPPPSSLSSPRRTQPRRSPPQEERNHDNGNSQRQRDNQTQQRDVLSDFKNAEYDVDEKDLQRSAFENLPSCVETLRSSQVARLTMQIGNTYTAQQCSLIFVTN
jgi:hypothetical protein